MADNKVKPPFPYEGGDAEVRDKKLSEPSLKALEEVEKGEVEEWKEANNAAEDL